jgi:DNA-binding transcriptional LysR family regulator
VELRQLRYFLAVAEEGRFSRAAHRLHIAAPSLSQQIQALERELGAPLFERTPQRVELTIAGQALVERTRVIIAEPTAAGPALRLTVRGFPHGSAGQGWTVHPIGAELRTGRSVLRGIRKARRAGAGVQRSEVLRGREDAHVS